MKFRKLRKPQDSQVLLKVIGPSQLLGRHESLVELPPSRAGIESSRSAAFLNPQGGCGGLFGGDTAAFDLFTLL